MLKNYLIKSTKFIIVGGTNTTLTYFLYVALIYVGFNYNLALIIEYLFGILTGYVMNKYWTFSDRYNTRNSLFKYIATYCVSFVFNLGILNWLVLYGILGPILGQLVALGIATVLSFLLQNFWVFRPQNSSI